MKKRLLALNLALVLLLSLLPFSALAVDADPSGTARYDSQGYLDHESVMFTPDETGDYSISYLDPNGDPVNLLRKDYSYGTPVGISILRAFDWDTNSITDKGDNYHRICYLQAGETYEFYLEDSNDLPGEWTFRAEPVELPHLMPDVTQQVSAGDAVFVPDADGYYYFKCSRSFRLSSEDGRESWNSGFYENVLVAGLRAGVRYYFTSSGNDCSVIVQSEIPKEGRLGYAARWSLSDDGVLDIWCDDYYSNYGFSRADSYPWDAFRDQITQVNIGRNVRFDDPSGAFWCRNLSGLNLTEGYNSNSYYSVSANGTFGDQGAILLRYSESSQPYDPESQEQPEVSTDYVVPDSVTRVSALAFTNLTYLETLTIPAKTFVERNAFVGTHSLREIHYLGSEAAWNAMQIAFDPGFEPTVTFAAEPPSETMHPIDDSSDRVAYPATRAGVVQMLWEMAGQPEPQSSFNPFTDVTNDSPYLNAILWAVEQGITNGESERYFYPGDSITRAQLVTFLYRAAGSPAASGPCRYQDVSGKAYYYEAVRWAQEHSSVYVFSDAEGDFFYPDRKVDSLVAEYTRYGDLARVLIGKVPCAEHHWEQSGEQEATCLRWGSLTYSCTECGAVKHERGSAPLGHEFQAWEIDREVNCWSSGSEKSVCAHCGKAVYRSIPTTGHDWSDWFVVKEPTEQQEGLMMRVCRRDFTHTEQALIPPLRVKITQQPADVKAEAGETAVFTVGATGDGLTWQWYSCDPGQDAWSKVAGADSESLSIAVTAETDGRAYRCEVSDRFGNKETTQSAKLYLLSEEPPVILTQPEDQYVPSGGNAVFTVSAKGSGLQYQWQYRKPGKTAWYASSGAGAKTPQLTIQATDSRDGYSYRCRVTTAAGVSVYSDAAAIHILNGPVIRTQPQDVAGVPGNTVVFTVDALGTGLTYQWQYKDVGGTWKNSSFKTASMSCKLTAERDGRQYRCKVTDASGESVTSRAATITVKMTLTITQQPKDFFGALGDTAVFSVTAVGEGLTYRWQYKDVGGAWANSSFKTATMSCKLTAERDGRQYRCFIRDAGGSQIISDPVVMSTQNPVVITSQPQNAAGKLGSVVKFRISAAGNDLTYQWQYSKDGGKNWIVSTNKTAVATCTLKSKDRDGWAYRCIVTDADGNRAVSNAAYISILPDLVVVKQPKAASGHIGDEVQFSVEATGSALTWQWQYSEDDGRTWVNSGCNTASAAFTVSGMDCDGRLYRCLITDSCGDRVYTETARLTVIPPVVITKQPRSVSGSIGDRVSLTVAAEGEGLTYQWQYSKNGGKTWVTSALKTATASFLLKDTSHDGWLYRCTVTDVNGYSVRSDAARVTVLQ